MSFQKRVEDFTCEHCGVFTEGDGYTNHCKNCLWSKHVDVNPGDRANACGGLMKPVGVEGGSPDYRISYICGKCGKTGKNVIGAGDDKDALIALAKAAASR